MISGIWDHNASTSLPTYTDRGAEECEAAGVGAGASDRVKTSLLTKEEASHRFLPLTDSIHFPMPDWDRTEPHLGTEKAQCLITIEVVEEDTCLTWIGDGMKPTTHRGTMRMPD